MPQPSAEPGGARLLAARELPDGELATRIAGATDREAEAELCRRFAGRIRLYGLRHLGSSAAAADLVQQVLVLVLQRLRAGQLRDPDRLGSYVLGTCRLAVQDDRREVARRAAQLDRFGGELAPRGADDGPPESALDLRRLDGCLQALAERERAVLIMTFYAERGADDIGSELGASPGNIRVIRHRALARLRGCMGVDDREDA